MSEDKVQNIKIIDFGSAHKFEDESSSHMATPEYLSPEILNRKQNLSRPWSIDVWSLGVFILEVITGIPVWMSFICTVQQGNHVVQKQGIFSAKGRATDKIVIKQQKLLENFKYNIRKNWGQWENAPNSNQLLDLLEKMLTWNPYHRISPQDIINHPYLN